MTPTKSLVAVAGHPAIEIRNVTKTYGGTSALEDVSLEVRQGEFLTLLGPSGSGKTTLLNIVAGFVRPERGSLLLAGKEVIHLPPHRRGVGMMFQNYALFPHMTVADNIAYPLRLRRYTKQDVAARVNDILKMVQLEGYGKRWITELSGGQRQRVALARSIVFEPQVLLMDEPLSALDKNLRTAMQLEIRRLHDRVGITTVCVTHDQSEALTMSDRIVVMSRGRIEQVGSPEQIYEAPSTRFVGTFIGDSTLLPLENAVSGPMLFGKPLLTSTPPPYGKAVELLVRPERLLLERPVGDANELSGTYRGSVYEGSSLHVELSMPTGQILKMRLNANCRDLLPAQGGRMTVYLPAKDAIVIGQSAA